MNLCLCHWNKFHPDVTLHVKFMPHLPIHSNKRFLQTIIILQTRMELVTRTLKLAPHADLLCNDSVSYCVQIIIMQLLHGVVFFFWNIIYDIILSNLMDLFHIFSIVLTGHLLQLITNLPLIYRYHYPNIVFKVTTNLNNTHK